MKVSRGIFSGERVMILEFGMEYPWEGVMRGLTKEAGEYYFYVVEDLTGKTHYVPRDAIQRISRLGKEKRRLKPKLAHVIRLERS
jgi:hypothetical protein